MNYFEVKRRLEAFQRRNHSALTIEEIADLLRSTIKGHKDRYATFDPGLMIYRSRIIGADYRPKHSNDLSYPPAEYCSIGRLNRDKEPIFYGSNGIIATFYEVKVSSGSYMALGSWQLMNKVLIARAGYSDKTFRRLGSNRLVSRDVDTDPKRQTVRNKSQNLIHEFICENFTAVDSQVGGNAYKISIALFDVLARSKVMNRSVDTGIKIDGINYPSVALKANDTNIALFPASVDRALRIYGCQIMIINYISSSIIDVTYIDNCKTINRDGSLFWSGSYPEWTKSCEGNVTFEKTETGWHVFDPQGRELHIP